MAKAKRDVLPENIPPLSSYLHSERWRDIASVILGLVVIVGLIVIYLLIR